MLIYAVPAYHISSLKAWSPINEGVTASPNLVPCILSGFTLGREDIGGIVKLGAQRAVCQLQNWQTNCKGVHITWGTRLCCVHKVYALDIKIYSSDV